MWASDVDVPGAGQAAASSSRGQGSWKAVDRGPMPAAQVHDANLAFVFSWATSAEKRIQGVFSELWANIGADAATEPNGTSRQYPPRQEKDSTASVVESVVSSPQSSPQAVELRRKCSTDRATDVVFPPEQPSFSGIVPAPEEAKPPLPVEPHTLEVNDEAKPSQAGEKQQIASKVATGSRPSSPLSSSSTQSKTSKKGGGFEDTRTSRGIPIPRPKSPGPGQKIDTAEHNMCSAVTQSGITIITTKPAPQEKDARGSQLSTMSYQLEVDALNTPTKPNVETVAAEQNVEVVQSFNLVEPFTAVNNGEDCNSSENGSIYGDIEMPTGEFSTRVSVLRGNPKFSTTSVERLNQADEWRTHMAEHIQKALTVNRFFGLEISFGSSGSGNYFKSLVNTKAFIGSCTFLIIASAVFIGIDTHVEMQATLRGSSDEVAESFLDVFSLFFCFAFTAEIICRLLAFRMEFFFGDEKGWNFFDLFLVVTSIVDIAFDSTAMRTFAILRGLRLIRVLRVIRLMRFFRDLRRMVVSILQSLAALSWALVLLLIIMYLFAIVFMQAATQIAHNIDTVEETEIEKFYGTMQYTMLTLLMAITGGVDWMEASEPLDYARDPAREGFAYRMVFATYVTFVVIGVLNVLTGIFVERACELSGVDRDLLVRAEISKQNSFLTAMRQIFEEADKDGSGSICWEEFKEYLHNDKIKAYLATQQLDAFDAQQLWGMLSSNDEGDKLESVDITSFIMGCMRLRGQAKSVDVAAMLSEQRHFKGKFYEFRTNCENLLGDLVSQIEELKDQALGQSQGRRVSVAAGTSTVNTRITAKDLSLPIPNGLNSRRGSNISSNGGIRRSLTATSRARGSSKGNAGAEGTEKPRNKSYSRSVTEGTAMKKVSLRSSKSGISEDDEDGLS